MAQHPLNSAAWRDFTLDTVEAMSEERVFEFFMQMRWGANAKAEQACPACGVIGKHYYKRTRRQWVCKDKNCGHTFSVTSGTILADHKLPLKKLLRFMVLYVHATKGKSASEMSRSVGVTMKTAFTLMHKFREALIPRETEKLKGYIQMDAGHFSGRFRKPRKKKKASAPALRNKIPASANPIHPNRRLVTAVRECFAPETGSQKAYRTLVFITHSENPKDATEIALEWIEPNSTVWTDEHPAYGSFAAYFDHATVNHSMEFSTDAGVNNNQAESFFMRCRRLVIGQIHRLTPKYMYDYAQEMAWREDVRHLGSARRILENLGKTVLNAPRSKWWSRYWQGHKRSYEVLYQAPTAA